MKSSIIETLRRRLGEIADVNAAAALLQWDQETYMPPKGARARGEQLGTLSALAHRLLTAPDLGALLHEAQEAAAPGTDDGKLADEALYDYVRATRLPEAFVREFAVAASNAYVVWVEARKESDFAQFQPHLETLVTLLRQKADLLSYEDSPYNALLEDYERGMTAERLKSVFAELVPRQSVLVRRIGETGRQPDASWLDQDWDESKQWDFTLRVLRDIGYDFEAGRQDKSVHPFTTSFDAQDVRITTRLNPRDPFSAIAGSIHEGGHGLYDQGFREEDRRTPLVGAPSLGIHESQSRMWENMVARSLPFWKHYTPVLREFFPSQLCNVSPEAVYRVLNRVRPSLIRVEADECTYNLHIVMRFEIELALIEGQIAVADVPSLWNAKMKEYLDLDVPDDRHGCLQDIHWSHGGMGYFPTYALGNLYAAQLFEKMQTDVPSLWDDVSRGDFTALLNWLREHVHRIGRRKLAPDLVRDATGADPSAAPYLHYLEVKYGELYGC